VIAAQAVERPVSKRVTCEVVSLRSKPPCVPQELKIYRPPNVALDEPHVKRAQPGILTDYAFGEARIAGAVDGAGEDARRAVRSMHRAFELGT
jgi:hypothetical protein